MLKDTAENSTVQKQEYVNYYNILHSMENKISVQISQIIPNFNKRSKRGIINGLGSIIKSITGNLDNEDAKRYDQAINSISDNQSKLKFAVDRQIIILQKSIDKFSNTSKILKQNQDLLSSRLMEVQNDIKSIKNSFLLVQTVCNQIQTAYQIIYDILEKIEVAISFAKLNTFHNAIVEPTDLLDEIKNISIHLDNGKLPFRPEIDNILYYEKILNIKSYSTLESIVFVIEVPIVENQNYNYYHLYPLPTPDQEHFKVIIPENNYLLLNEHNFMYFEEKCKEINTGDFLCQGKEISVIRASPPCEIQMLMYFKDKPKCQPIAVTIEETKIQKLEENKWMLIAPTEITAVRDCGIKRDHIPVKGTFVLEIYPRCEVQVNGLTLKTPEIYKSEFVNLELPKLYFNVTPSKIIDHINLKTVNLHELSNIQSALREQHELIQKINDYPIYIRKTSVWTILLYGLLAIMLLIGLCKYVSAKMKKPGKPESSEDPGKNLAEIVI